MNKPVRHKPEEPEQDYIEISVRLTSGKFESCMKLPLNASVEDIESALGNWWDTLESIIKCQKRN